MDKEIKDIFDSHHKLDEKTLDTIESMLLSFRYLRAEYINYTQKTINDLFVSLNYQYAYYPIDIYELRNILEKNKVSCLFSLDFCKKYLIDYPIWLGFEFDGEGVGGLTLDPKEIKLVRAFINIDAVSQDQKIDAVSQDQKKVDSITDIFKELVSKELLYEVKVFFENPIFSRSSVAIENSNFRPKIASPLHKYVVNIGNIEIENEIINSNSPEDAVIEAVSKKWDSIKDSYHGGDLNYRPPRFDPKTWLAMKESPMWADIVKEASKTFNLKTSQSN